MRRFSDRPNLHTLSELNVTPMLDLAFVLLIIFMITTPLMDNSLDLIVPSSEATTREIDPTNVQTIAIHPDESITLNTVPTDLSALEIELLALREARPELAVVIRSHRELPVQKLVDVMDVVQRAKITKIGVVTNPEN